MNRLKELIDYLGLSPEEFAKVFGIHRSSVYRYMGTNKKEVRDIPIELAIRISDKYNISLDWLVGNPNSSMFRNQSTDMLTEIYNGLSEEGKRELFSYAIYLRGKEQVHE